MYQIKVINVSAQDEGVSILGTQEEVELFFNFVATLRFKTETEIQMLDPDGKLLNSKKIAP